ncbi:head-tail adaptor protein [Arsenicitalea aurantiaca]|uniref:Head-tail adaptor protein n=1 Tax=Arsenicitalea aurantiaca TaxID=1783274 RepID=A0A433XAE5_9HYPH|nr:phage head closure protein [Arsenicitalea aurantiaca]RUT30998.1 head-tail adaptor protein [Arsenicitalea aurantiaca]
MSERAPGIGALTDRVELARRDMAPLPGGGHEVIYVPLGRAWARVRVLSGRRGELADGRAVTISHAVVLRWRSDIGPGDRIIYRGEPLDVVSAGDLNGRRAWLSCACSAGRVIG